MTLILLFIFCIVGLSLWWLLRQGVMQKPWLETGIAAPVGPRLPAARLGLGVFLSVVGALFALFGSAFVMRMDLEVWSALTLPGAVWTNTALLLLASLFLHLAKRAPRPETTLWASPALVGAGLATGGFLIGQVMVWQQLQGSGHGLTSGPAASFFYLLSGLHGLHILGGLVALARVLTRRAPDPGKRRLNLGLCSTYWDFLLLVWIVLLLLFTGWGNQLLDLCRSILP